jgi:oxygen-dependent protoporphyrinogen oxidase
VIKVSTGVGPLNVSHLISSNPSLLPTSLAPPPIPFSTVSVINIAFPTPAAESPLPPGFGYLIPRSIPASKNPHRALGVIFDSDVMPGVDDSAAHFTKITIIFGGAYWLDNPPKSAPSKDEMVEWAKTTLGIHFPDREFPQPAYVHTSHHVRCIPQVPVGYPKELKRTSEVLRDQGRGTLALVGGGMGAVGVNGAVRGGWEVGTGMANFIEGSGNAVTGLEMWE